MFREVQFSCAFWTSWQLRPYNIMLRYLCDFKTSIRNWNWAFQTFFFFFFIALSEQWWKFWLFASFSSLGQANHIIIWTIYLFGRSYPLTSLPELVVNLVRPDQRPSVSMCKVLWSLIGSFLVRCFINMINVVITTRSTRIM